MKTLERASSVVGIPALALILSLASCSKSDSPTAPKPSPTPQAATLTLSVSTTQAPVGQEVEARATVRQGSAPVPNGTPVTFTLPSRLCWFDLNNNGQEDEGEIRLCSWFVENNESSITKETSSGVASAVWKSGLAGDVTVSASAGSASQSATVRFFGPTLTLVVSATQALVTQQVEARATVLQGSAAAPDGTPVKFDLSFSPEQDCKFVENNLPSITKLTTGGVASAVWTCAAPGNVSILASAGAASQIATVEVLAAEQPAGMPKIYSVSPNQGSWQGGEEVTIFGENLCVYFHYLSGACLPSVKPEVVFSPPGAFAEVTWVSPDGRALRVKTPALGTAPPAQDTPASVSVTNATGSNSVNGLFAYRTDTPAPQLFALMPNAGPIEGGTRVTIFGAGFQAPVQVLFGDRQAQVLSSNYSEIVCLAPSIAPANPSTPTVVNVTVTNILTGRTSTNALQYRYGEAMFVSGISPNQGSLRDWTPATIYGQGFVAPVQVVVTAGSLSREAQVLSVSGTSIEVKMPPFTELFTSECQPVTATFTVTNLGSNLQASGPTFTYVCSPFSGP